MHDGTSRIVEIAETKEGRLTVSDVRSAGASVTAVEDFGNMDKRTVVDAHHARGR